MSGWFAFDVGAWELLAESHPQPWAPEVASMDLRYWADRERMGRGSRPGLAVLARRWGWMSKTGKPSVKRVRLLIRGGAWEDERTKRARQDPEQSSLPIDHAATHDALVARAVRWLRNSKKCAAAYGELVTKLPVIPDALGFTSGGWSILVECKRTRSDFKADAKKWMRSSGMGPGQERWYLTPKGLLKPEEVPDGWGLAEVRGERVCVVVKAPKRQPDPYTRQYDLMFLASAAKRHQAGLKWDPVTGKCEAYT